MKTDDYQMDGDLDTFRTIENADGVYLKAYNTTDSIKVAVAGRGFEAGAWFTREQALEFIACLSRIVYSGDDPIARVEAAVDNCIQIVDARMPQ